MLNDQQQQFLMTKQEEMDQQFSKSINSRTKRKYVFSGKFVKGKSGQVQNKEDITSDLMKQSGSGDQTYTDEQN